MTRFVTHWLRALPAIFLFVGRGQWANLQKTVYWKQKKNYNDPKTRFLTFPVNPEIEIIRRLLLWMND